MADSITPPQELRDKWLDEAPNTSVYDYLIDSAAQWGADQELEACCEWTAIVGGADALRAARRPNPPRLKERALEQLREVNAMLQFQTTGGETSAIRRALEALPDG
jgi:hypothetical protein